MGVEERSVGGKEGVKRKKNGRRLGRLGDIVRGEEEMKAMVLGEVRVIVLEGIG